MPKVLTPAWIRPRLYHLLSPLAALVLVGVLDRYTNLVKQFEYQTVNLRFQARARFDPPADPRLIFVGIDEPSLQHFGRWPWPRSVEADFVDTIAGSGVNPHTLAFDLMFTELSNKLGELPAGTEDDDERLGKSISQLGSVITGALRLPEPNDPGARKDAETQTRNSLANPGYTVPLPNIKGDIQQINRPDPEGRPVPSNVADLPVLPIRTQSFFAFVNDEPSGVDGIRHSIPMVVRVCDKVYPSLALQTLCQMLNVDPDKVEVDLPGRQVRLTNSSGKTWNIPIDAHGLFTINYRRDRSFQSVGFFWLMRELYNHAKTGDPLPPQCNIENKTLLIGQSATALGDMGPSPLAPISPLPYAHLNVINNVLKGDYLTFVPWYWVVIGWSLITWPTLLRVKDAALAEAVSVPIALIVAYHVIVFAIFWLWSIQIALVWPVASYALLNFGAVVLRWREERRGREQLKQTFGQMISPEIMNHLLENPEQLKLGGTDRPSTVMFSDVRDFTKFSEGLTAEEVMNQLNVYFERMVPCVKECQGTFHKYIGDAIMAAWGDIEAASLGVKTDAQNAVKSALMMRRCLRVLNEERHAAGHIPIRIGIGLNHDVVQAGMLGSSERKEFTVMGDGVNTASRLEGLTKEFKTDLAISDSVRQLIGDEFLVRRLGLIVLKGKSKATMVYEVLAEKSDVAAARMSPGGVARYEEAFDHLLARRFEQAEVLFAACVKDYPDDHCAKTYLGACREFLVTPPPDDWDGRIVMTTK